MIDWLIKDAQIIDGTGVPSFRGDIAISGERILEIGRLGNLEAERLVKADGKFVSPGFIDMHSHSDLLFLNGSSIAHKIYQGVTADLVGQDGMSAAPITGASKEPLAEMLEPLAGPLKREWQPWDLKDYLRALKEQRTPINVMTLVGHCNLRLAIMGYRMALPTREEMRRMGELLAISLKQGAVGLSLGLIYPPSSYSDVNELIGLGKIVKDHDALLVAHIRNEEDQIFQALEEMIRVGRESGCKIHISHLKCLGKKNWGKMPRVLEMLERALESGVDISFDQYPYTASCTSLSVLLPGWAMEGGWKAFQQRIGQTEEVNRILVEMRKTIEKRGGPGSITIASVQRSENRGLVGKTMEQISNERGIPSDQAVLEILTEEELQVIAIYHAMSEIDVELAMAHGLHTVGSDGILGEFPHPRAYGTFPRIIHHFSRGRKLFPIEEAVRKMTSAPAKRLGLKNRGQVNPGYIADLLLFDPETFQDTATFESPRQFARGLDWAFVNGIPLLEDGKIQKRLPGRIITRG
jgi:N-acyl-D-amino-acid deacylase